MDKKYIILIVCILLLSIIGTSVYFLRKKSSSSQKDDKPNPPPLDVNDPTTIIPISIKVSNKGLVNNSENELNITELSRLTVLELLNKFFSVMNPFYKIKKISLNSKDIRLQSNGKPELSSNNVTITKFLNTGVFPQKIDISFDYDLDCGPNKPTDCNPCDSSEPICTDQGWICSSKTLCPTGNILASCCSKRTDGKIFAVCDQTSKDIFCTVCPPKDKPNCLEGKSNEELQKLWGPVCTGTGWVCQEGKGCPPRDRMNAIFGCTNNTNAVCSVDSNGNAYSDGCTSCTGDPPECDYDEKLLCGSVCVNGEWQCKQGVKTTVSGNICPPDKPKIKLPIINRNSSKLNNPPCDSDSIANNPIFNVICENCDALPKPTIGQSNYDEKCDLSKNPLGTCKGHAWTCTVDGWKCLPNQKRPETGFNLNSCCTSNVIGGVKNLNGIWDSNKKCVTCICEVGSLSVPAECGGSTISREARTCCPSGSRAMKDSNGNVGCCNGETCSSNVESDFKCCEAGQKCVAPGKCGTLCGTKACNDGDVCMQINNLNNDNIKWWQNNMNNPSYADNKISITGNAGNGQPSTGTWNVNFCKPKENCLHENALAIPASINNYYPCQSFSYDPPTGEIGFCKAKYEEGTNVEDCIKLGFKNSCNANSRCEWKNILGEMAVTSNLYSTVNEVNTYLNKARKNKGQYCNDTSNTSWSRLIGYKYLETNRTTDSNKYCNPRKGFESCWTLLAQPGISKIQYSPNNGVCVGVQDCNLGNSIMQSYTINTSGTMTSANANNPIIPVQLNSSFPSCSTPNLTCPITNDGSQVLPDFTSACSPSNGKIVNPTYDCTLDITDKTNGYICVINPEEKGKGFTGCNSNCPEIDPLYYDIYYNCTFVDKIGYTTGMKVVISNVENIEEAKKIMYTMEEINDGTKIRNWLNKKIAPYKTVVVTGSNSIINVAVYDSAQKTATYVNLLPNKAYRECGVNNKILITKTGFRIEPMKYKCPVSSISDVLAATGYTGVQCVLSEDGNYNFQGDCNKECPMIIGGLTSYENRNFYNISNDNIIKRISSISQNEAKITALADPTCVGMTYNLTTSEAVLYKGITKNNATIVFRYRMNLFWKKLNNEDDGVINNNYTVIIDKTTPVPNSSSTGVLNNYFLIQKDNLDVNCELSDKPLSDYINNCSEGTKPSWCPQSNLIVPIGALWKREGYRLRNLGVGWACLTYRLRHFNIGDRADQYPNGTVGANIGCNDTNSRYQEFTYDAQNNRICTYHWDEDDRRGCIDIAGPVTGSKIYLRHTHKDNFPPSTIAKWEIL